MPNIIDLLKERGFIDAVTSEEIRQIAEKPLKVYCGFDPTSDSLHVGNMVAIMGLAWFQRCGHTPFVIVGGATGMIGDPSGKSTERQLLSPEILQHNVKGIQKNLETLLFQDKEHRAIILNNLEWYKHLSCIDFLRDLGKYFRIGPMLAKESVRARMNSEEGMSYTEFSYQVLQAYDFLYLCEQHGVTVQMGGSDQWGNITAGTELIRKVIGKSTYGVTFPLLTRSDGQKFGKSEKGAIWLSPEKLSAYEFYQYFVRMPDADVITLMKLLTFMDMDEIRRYEQQMKQSDYVPNTAQKRLAEEITRLIHGEEGLNTAVRTTSAAAPGAKTALDLATLEQLSKDIPSFNLQVEEVLGTKLIDLLVNVGLQPSKGEARRLIRNGGVYLNNEQVKDENLEVRQEMCIEKRMLLLSVGKKSKALIILKTLD